MGTITADGVIALCYTVSATSEKSVPSERAVEVLCLLGLMERDEPPWLLDTPRFQLHERVWSLVSAIRHDGPTEVQEKLLHQWFEENTL